MNFNKLSKYSYRFTKSIQQKNNIKTNEYAEHLKYYIQKGGNSVEVNKQLNSLSQIISEIEKSPDLNLIKIKESLKQKEEKLAEFTNR